MAKRVREREITNDEGNRLPRTVRRDSGSVVTWRRAQIVLLSAQGMDTVRISEVTFTSPDRLRDVVHNFNADGFDSLLPRYAGGRPPKFNNEDRAAIKQVALAKPGDHGLPFSTWPLGPRRSRLPAWSRTRRPRTASGVYSSGVPSGRPLVHTHRLGPLSSDCGAFTGCSPRAPQPVDSAT